MTGPRIFNLLKAKQELWCHHDHHQYILTCSPRAQDSPRSTFAAAECESGIQSWRQTFRSHDTSTALKTTKLDEVTIGGSEGGEEVQGETLSISVFRDWADEKDPAGETERKWPLGVS